MSPRITLWTALLALTGSLALFAGDLAACEPSGAIVPEASEATSIPPFTSEAAK